MHVTNPIAKSPEEKYDGYAEGVIPHQQIAVKHKGENQVNQQILLFRIDASDQVPEGEYHPKHISSEKKLLCQPGRKEKIEEA
jgi:hypothetical protein